MWPGKWAPTLPQQRVRDSSKAAASQLRCYTNACTIQAPRKSALTPLGQTRTRQMDAAAALYLRLPGATRHRRSRDARGTAATKRGRLDACSQSVASRQRQTVIQRQPPAKVSMRHLSQTLSGTEIRDAHGDATQRCGQARLRMSKYAPRRSRMCVWTAALASHTQSGLRRQRALHNAARRRPVVYTAERANI
jgi:hypothetical protein